MRLEGDFYTGADSRRQTAQLAVAGDALCLVSGGGEQAMSWNSIKVSPRVGNTPRYVYLPDDGVFETSDNDGVDRLVLHFKPGRLNGFIHRLENHLGLILVAAVITVAVTLFTFFYGVPWTSRVVADLMPQSVKATVSASTLRSMDMQLFSPSELPEHVQERVHDHFAPLLLLHPELPLNVEFRSSESIGANAMALPDGTIIFTDALVVMAENDEELAAVLAHEIGHVVHNHGMTGVVQSSLVFWVIVMMTGDLSAFADTTVSVPAVLMSLAYSRDMEREADTYALGLMQAQNIEPMYFISIMQRLEDSHGQGLDEAGHQEGSVSAEKDNGWLSHLEGLVSSHPLTEERIRRFEAAR
ncbi:M48 family metallopeptidase [Marinobacter nanhaiticus D15-8W]|uniref:Zn-dependent protease n=2 Tax=Marinobacter TaxID=2742 RepID=N6X5S9_9GAMM|nr:Zn-dependent protease [Marinobacter nanhaiticus D15-8W]BES72251.1 M48 family metallopeptidase [Marinobacter nanhaiticus D15-8W]